MSNNPEDVLSVAKSEKHPVDPREIIKDPMVLEFLGLKQESSYYEKDLETKIITHLQEFLLELGNGFAFMSRQKRIHLDGDDFFLNNNIMYTWLSILMSRILKSILTFISFLSFTSIFHYIR